RYRGSAIRAGRSPSRDRDADLGEAPTVLLLDEAEEHGRRLAALGAPDELAVPPGLRSAYELDGPSLEPSDPDRFEEVAEERGGVPAAEGSEGASGDVDEEPPAGGERRDGLGVASRPRLAGGLEDALELDVLGVGAGGADEEEGGRDEQRASGHALTSEIGSASCR